MPNPCGSYNPSSLILRGGLCSPVVSKLNSYVVTKATIMKKPRTKFRFPFYPKFEKTSKFGFGSGWLHALVSAKLFVVYLGIYIVQSTCSQKTCSAYGKEITVYISSYYKNSGDPNAFGDHRSSLDL